ncbi:MAG: hypothetical protein OEV64_01985 [Desulfobulbaceae bacterium]|nr:hypothetical protein [Desulfobulbaceae bacterium]
MKQLNKFSDWLGRTVYGLISLSLGTISLAMMGVALWNIWVSVHEKTLLVKALLDAIGLIVIGMAVFDVSKFLLEEEVFCDSGKKSAAMQRDTLLKFLVIIAIAVSLEALVFVFDAGKKDIAMLIYPTFLLIAVVFIVISLGIYQKLTRE